MEKDKNKEIQAEIDEVKRERSESRRLWRAYGKGIDGDNIRWANNRIAELEKQLKP